MANARQLEGTAMAAKNARLARICWKSKITGATGHGEWFPAHLVRLWVGEMNSEYDILLHHWAEYK